MVKLIALLIYIAVGSVAAIEISSKIDFDNEDVSGSDSSSDKSDTVVILIGNSNTDTRKGNRGSQSPVSRPRAGGNVSLRGPVKPIRSHDNYPPNFQPTRSKVVKNICIVLNGKGTPKPGNFECREGVCETTLSTETDDMGNTIDSVRLTIVTKAEEPKQVEDVPVVDGVRGVQYDNRNPTFAFDNGPAARPHPPFLDNNIPQAPVYRPNQVPRRNRPGPQSASFYPRNFGSRKTTTAWRPSFPGTGSVDDKIEPPFSQTITSDE